MELQNLAQYRWMHREINEIAQAAHERLDEGLFEFIDWLLTLAPSGPVTMFVQCYFKVESTWESEYRWWLELITTGDNSMTFQVVPRTRISDGCHIRAYYEYSPNRILPCEIGEYWNLSTIPVMQAQMEALRVAWIDHVALDFKVDPRGMCVLKCTLVR